MSEAGMADEAVGHDDPVTAGAITAGALMRNAREAAGLHVAALAVSMKIPVKKLEALEADRLDLLHDAVFVRALAASVCRALKIDPAPVLEKLPLNTAPRLNPDERGINAPFRTPGGAAKLSLAELLTKPSSILVLTLVAAAVAVFFVPDIKLPNWSFDSATQAGKPSEPTDQLPVMPPSTAVQEVAQAPVAVASYPATPVNAGDSVPLVPKPAVSAPPLPVIKPSAPVVAASDANRTVVAAPIPKTGLVVFRAKGSSWVKVVDAKGIVQLSKTLAEGEVVGVSGTTPLSIVIGRADATEVEVRGQAFGLTGVSKENVARFEVK